MFRNGRLQTIHNAFAVWGVIETAVGGCLDGSVAAVGGNQHSVLVNHQSVGVVVVVSEPNRFCQKTLPVRASWHHNPPPSCFLRCWFNEPRKTSKLPPAYVAPGRDSECGGRPERAACSQETPSTVSCWKTRSILVYCGRFSIGA